MPLNQKIETGPPKEREHPYHSLELVPIYISPAKVLTMQPLPLEL
jgi:hypothetical protein